MGRRKVEMKRIEDKYARQTSFSKRRNGLLKKARDLSVLCDADVAAIIFSSRGKPYHYCSSDNLSGILRRYQSHVAIGEGSSKETIQYPESEGGELLQIEERELGEPWLNQLGVTDLAHLQKQLEDALSLTRSIKTHLMLDSISRLHEKEMTLAEEIMHQEEKLARTNTNGRKNMDLNMLAENECQIK